MLGWTYIAALLDYETKAGLDSHSSPISIFPDGIRRFLNAVRFQEIYLALCSLRVNKYKTSIVNHYLAEKVSHGKHVDCVLASVIRHHRLRI